MKYFIIGLHASGKQEVMDILDKYNVKCGHQFSNIDKASEDVYNSHNYILYTSKVVNEIFENNAYIFLQELQSSGNINAFKFYEGLSYDEFDKNDVFVISPDQLMAISPTAIREPVCFIWLDNHRSNRIQRYHFEKRSYNFVERDQIERRDISSFVKTLYSFNNSNVLYFTDEEPSRVATIIYSLIQHPDLLPHFIKYFNN